MTKRGITPVGEKLLSGGQSEASKQEAIKVSEEGTIEETIEQ